jgi:type II secretory pathway predicted ATPase ExeA
VEKGQISLATLIMALFYDLATDFKIPTQPERRERALRGLIRKRQKPIALFIDDAHDLHSKTLI